MIVVGEFDTAFVDVATRTVTDTVPASGEHEEVRIYGNLAYATNLLSSDTMTSALYVFDMTTHTLVATIALGGDGATRASGDRGSCPSFVLLAGEHGSEITL